MGSRLVLLAASTALVGACGPGDEESDTPPAPTATRAARAAETRPGVSPERCVKRFNSDLGDGGRNFVQKSGKDPGYGPVEPGYMPLVWIGPSGVKPSKCLLWVTLGSDDGAYVAIRESLFENSRAGFQPIPGSDEDDGLIRSPNAYGTSDGKVHLGPRP